MNCNTERFHHSVRT